MSRRNKLDIPHEVSIENLVSRSHHAYPLSYGAIFSYMISNKESGHDASDAG